MNKKGLRFQQLLSALLIVAAVALLGWLSTQYKRDFDLTAATKAALGFGSTGTVLSTR